MVGETKWRKSPNSMYKPLLRINVENEQQIGKCVVQYVKVMYNHVEVNMRVKRKKNSWQKVGCVFQEHLVVVGCRSTILEM